MSELGRVDSNYRAHSNYPLILVLGSPPLTYALFSSVKRLKFEKHQEAVSDSWHKIAYKEMAPKETINYTSVGLIYLA